ALIGASKMCCSTRKDCGELDYPNEHDVPPCAILRAEWVAVAFANRAVKGRNMSGQSRRYFNGETKVAYTKPNLSRRRVCLSLSAAALGGLAVAQSSTRAAIVRVDVAGLPPFGMLPSGIRSRTINNINGLAVHALEAGFETKGRQCILLL